MTTKSTKLMVLAFGLVTAFALGMTWHGYSQQNTTSASDLTGGEFKGGPVGMAGPPKVQAQGGGNNILLNPGGGNVGIGTFTPSEQLEITGNFRLPASTTTTGIIMSGGDPFIHNFGQENFFAGVNAGNLTMTGFSNTGVGDNALAANAGGSNNTATGLAALLNNSTGGSNTATGMAALLKNTAGAENTATGMQALPENTTGNANTAAGSWTLISNTTGNGNTALGASALVSNTSGLVNTAVGAGADVSAGNLTNATAIGANAVVDASNKVRLGDSNVIVIEGQVAFTFTSDANQKENFLAIDGEDTLEKLSQIRAGSWNYQGHDPARLRHYGPTAQDFFAAFGHDGLGTIGTDTTINSGDLAGIMMIAIQGLEKRTALLESQRGEMAELQERIDALEARLADRK